MVVAIAIAIAVMVASIGPTAVVVVPWFDPSIGEFDPPARRWNDSPRGGGGGGRLPPPVLPVPSDHHLPS